MKQNKMFSNVHHIPAFPTNFCGWDWKFMTDFRGMILKRDSCVQWVRINIKQIKYNKCTRSSSPSGIVLGLPASSRLQLHLDSSSFVFMMRRPLEGIQTLLLFPETQSVHVCVWKISLIPLKLSQSAITIWFTHVHVRVSARERESVKKTREKTTKSELAQVNVQLSRLHRVCCVYVWLCLYMCVCQ